MNSLFLTNDEVADLTGIKRGHDGKTKAQLQCDYLIQNKIHYYPNVRGEPVIVRARLYSFDVVINPNNKVELDYQLQQFNGEKPYVWIEKNIEKNIFDKNHILNNCISYPTNNDLRYSGLYFLIHEKNIVYVGISKNISYRLLQHERTEKLFTEIFIIKFPEMAMSKLEEFYIHAFKPFHNFNYPSKTKETKELLEKYKGFCI